MPEQSKYIDLTGKTAIVTGASRGLGEQMARELAARGAAVCINYFASPDRAEKMAAQIIAAGGKAIAIKADVREEADVKRMVADTRKSFGPIDIIVNNGTGPQPFFPIEEQTWENYMDQLLFFVKAPLLLMKEVVVEMKSRHYGRVINIGSEVFERGVPKFANYVSAKGAQLGLTRSWAMELAPWGITVNQVSPGWIPTERHADCTQQEIDEYTAGVPMKRMGEQNDPAQAVAFLASEGARFITGQKISVNGGHTLF